jgi:hypothetical protein
MGAPTSSIFSEIYLQYLEGTQLLDIWIRQKILEDFHYVDDILVIYNATTTNIQTVLDQFKDTSPTLSSTMEMEKNNSINFLNISISKHNETFDFKIYRKHTTTDTLIPLDSNYPLPPPNTNTLLSGS